MKFSVFRSISPLIRLLLPLCLLTALGCQHPWRGRQAEDELFWREKFEKSLTPENCLAGPGNAATTATSALAEPVSESIATNLAPGDLLDVVYYFENELSDENYRINVNDRLKVSFAETPIYDSEMTVRPDGRISLLMLGDLLVANKTASEFQSELEKRYSELLENPTIGVQVLQAHTKASELKDSIVNSTHGQNQQVLVRPDGCISLPMLGDLQAANLTPEKLGLIIQEAYGQAGIGNVRVTVLVKEARSSVVYILGDVMRQGIISLRGPTDLWRAIAEAGGFTHEADRRQVIVARSSGSGERRFTLDFEKWRRQPDSGENLYLQSGDVIFVPKAAARAVYLAGELVRPGQVVVDPEMTLTVSAAVALAGGVNGRGSEKQILLLRRSGTEPLIVSVNLQEIFDRDRYAREGEPPPWDPELRPGDIVYAPASFVGRLGRFAEQWFRNGLWAIVPFGTSANYSYLDGNTTSKLDQ